MSASERPRRVRKQEEAIAALLAKPTIVDAAKTAGIGESTLRRWLSKPQFAGNYRAARRQAFEAAIAALQQASGEAVATLRRNLSDPAPQGVQVRAALGILEQAVRAVEVMDLAER